MLVLWTLENRIEQLVKQAHCAAGLSPRCTLPSLMSRRHSSGALSDALTSRAQLSNVPLFCSPDSSANGRMTDTNTATRGDCRVN